MFVSLCRKIPIDMAGFAIQLDLILSRPDIVMGVTKDGKSSPPGYLETTLLEQFVTRENVECRGVSGEVNMQQCW